MPVDILRDLRTEFGEARDQDARPTCMAFAASDAHAGLRTGWDPLSAEWAYYYAVRRDGGKPEDGATLGSMLKALEMDGQPPEAGAGPISQRPFTTLQDGNHHRESRLCSGATAISSPLPLTRSLAG
jgi:hypothetical protein